MDVLALPGQVSLMSSCACPLFTLTILGIRLQMLTAKTQCPLGGMMYYNMTMTSLMQSYMTLNKRTRTKRQRQAVARRDNDIKKLRDQLTNTKKREFLKKERLSPEEFEQFFIHKYLLTPKPTRSLDDKLNSVTTISTTEARDYNYLEPYWASGDWILYTPIPHQRYSPAKWGAYLDWRYLTTPTHPSTLNPNASTTPTKPGDTPAPNGWSWSIFRHCFPICLTIYKDFGPVCATRLVEQGYFWATQYKDFDDYCALQYFNCAAVDYSFGYKIAHRGWCPKKYEYAEMGVSDHDGVIPENFQFDSYHLKLSYPIWFSDRLTNLWNLKNTDNTFKQEPPFRLDYKWDNYFVNQYRAMLDPNMRGWFDLVG